MSDGVETRDDLPDGWTSVGIGDILRAQYGKALKSEMRKPGPTLVYGSGGAIGKHDEALTSGETIVIGRKGSVGAVYHSSAACWPIDTTYFISDFGPFTARFLYFQLSALDLGRLDTSSAIPGLNRDDIYAQSLSVPPLVEQYRIVAAVEALLARISAARERLNRVPATLKRFRQAVLAAACSGRLTEDWRQENPKCGTGSHLLADTALSTGSGPSLVALGKSASDQFSELTEIPPSWCWAPFAMVTNNFDGQRIPVKADDRAKRQGKYPYYGASGVIDAVDDYLFDGEYLLIGEDGANLLSRTTPIAFRASGQFWVNNHAHILQARGGIPLRYLEIYVNGIDLQDYVTGTAQPKLTQASLNRIPVPVPPLPEQEEIVRRVDALFALADRIEAKLAAARRRTDRLTQAVLAKAFRGELVPTEAELARREGREYEPASALLERIRAERGQDGGGKQTTRRGVGRRKGTDGEMRG